MDARKKRKKQGLCVNWEKEGAKIQRKGPERKMESESILCVLGLTRELQTNYRDNNGRK
jgi:hypothetical protein